MKILVTGFHPFADNTINPSLEIINQLPCKIDHAEIIKLPIPTIFKDSSDVLLQALLKHQPDAVLMLGQAGGRTGITLERIAINLDDARIPDNAGNQPIDEIIQKDGQNAYFSSLPIKAIVDAIKKSGLPASISNSAGTFVCNHLMYQGLYFADTQFPKMRVGFMHVPYIPIQTADIPNQPSMNLSDILHSVQITIQTIIAFHQTTDQKIIGGTLH